MPEPTRQVRAEAVILCPVSKEAQKACGRRERRKQRGRVRSRDEKPLPGECGLGRSKEGGEREPIFTFHETG